MRNASEVLPAKPQPPVVKKIGRANCRSHNVMGPIHREKEGKHLWNKVPFKFKFGRELNF